MSTIPSLRKIRNIPNLPARLVLVIDPDIDLYGELLFELDRFILSDKPHRVPTFVRKQKPLTNPPEYGIYEVTPGLPIDQESIAFLATYYSTRFFADFYLEYIDEGGFYLAGSEMMLGDLENPADVKIFENGLIGVGRVLDIRWCPSCGHVLSREGYCFNCV
ncbi:hypothetical protein [Desulfitobacterium hafniense]|uniref:Uncharacterized protein n=2 Tax=Desulfitobacterium hafniense TaxID=49338 RepID=Q24NU8_DESHY|nr:hypothetical protein [Desulfitobacterium hafniense]BAE86294.1 hypothetical protein DSY4505 [Desulfitobacterium hafniense Y51]CDX04769.1 Hypothetical protein DPCES_4883 [Desulfitobacterium hafniense]